MGTTLLTMIMAICMTETRLTNIYTPMDGHSPSVGQCQIKIATAKRYDKKVTVKKLMNKEYNVQMAHKIFMHEFIRYNGDVLKALSAYNNGSFTKKNIKYVKKVLKHYYNYGLVFNH